MGVELIALYARPLSVAVRSSASPGSTSQRRRVRRPLALFHASRQRASSPRSHARARDARASSMPPGAETEGSAPAALSSIVYLTSKHHGDPVARVATLDA